MASKKKPKFSCHICGLKIDPGIVDPHHPLFLTVDHVQPKSMGGSNHASNKKPAHRICNQTRGTQSITEALRLHCRTIAQNSIHSVIYPKRSLPPRPDKWRVYRDKKTHAWIAKWKTNKNAYRSWSEAIGHVMRVLNAGT